MSNTIKDGKGRGYLAEVDSENFLRTRAVVLDEAVYFAREYGNSYYVTSSSMTLNSTNSHVVLFLQNTNSSRPIQINGVSYSWNGGSTNHNRVMRIRIIKTTVLPSANYEEATAVNLNWGSSTSPDVLIYKWDGVGDGMTISSGLSIFDNWVDKGFTPVLTRGVPIVRFNNGIVIEVTGEEIGTFSCSFEFFTDMT